uniref:Auxin-responsive protein SAUR71 n=1 Tax=Leersia perrieri TaxID=77586 RepID=A0A0D9VX41_9ORYZ
MRQLIRRLSRVGDYAAASSPSSSTGKRRGGAAKTTPEGHVPVDVVGEGGEEAPERFLVRAELLGRPAMAELLGRAAQEYGYDHRGPLRIPCSPAAFRRALAGAGRAGGDHDDDG